jgi:hypothetical protein
MPLRMNDWETRSRHHCHFTALDQLHSSLGGGNDEHCGMDDVLSDPIPLLDDDP